MKELLNRLFEHDTFSSSEAKTILLDLASGKYNSSQMAGFIAAFCMRNMTLNELSGFREAMLELCRPVDLSSFDAIDLCGTGGDGKHTFNISTLASFVVAGAGYHVAKHGNYGLSSLSGSSNVIEYLGYRFSDSEDQLRESMEKAHICFIHAPLFHPAMKTVAPIRKELGVKTFFNMLGPLVNPARPGYQLVGVFSLELARLYYYLYQNMKVSFAIVHSLDGYDEVSLTSDLKIFSNSGEYILPRTFFGKEAAGILPTQILGGESIEAHAAIFKSVLEGRGSSPQNLVVCWNAAIAIRCLCPHKTLEECYEEASQSLLSGQAHSCFKKLLDVNKKMDRCA